MRVMVVDDHPMWRDAVERDLEAAGFTVVATAATGTEAVNRAAAARPQVVVLDLQIPEPNGVEVTAAVLGADPSARVLILSASGEQDDVLEAVKAGATGYLVKSASREELVDAVRRGQGVLNVLPLASVKSEIDEAVVAFRRSSEATAAAAAGA